MLGHAFEMAKASNVTFTIEAQRVPLLPDVLKLISQGMLTRGDKNNRVYVGETVRISEYVSPQMQSALFDPQTAGGLLISLPAANADEFLTDVPETRVIGTVTAKTDYFIEVS